MWKKTSVALCILSIVALCAVTGCSSSDDDSTSTPATGTITTSVQ